MYVCMISCDQKCLDGPKKKEDNSIPECFLK